MASSLEFVRYAAEQMGAAGEITYKKMFGEYGIYCNGKIVGLICENQLFIKITEAGRRLCPDYEEVPPYQGSKPYLLVEDIDDRELLAELTAETFRELPVSKPGKKKGEKSREKADKASRAEEKQSAQKQEKKGKADMEKVDFKKRDKALYQPGRNPEFADVPEMVFLAVDGKGDPNTSVDYKNAVGALYALSYTIKMSKKSDSCPPGYFDYVVPPLEGLWHTEEGGFDGKMITDKSKFCRTSRIRQPDFVTEEVLEWAKEVCLAKKPETDTSNVRLLRYKEGMCAQVMHIGPYDDEPETIEKLERFIEANGYETEINETRRHHEIYLGDPRKTAPDKLKTVLRHPVRKSSRAAQTGRLKGEKNGINIGYKG